MAFRTKTRDNQIVETRADHLVRQLQRTHPFLSTPPPLDTRFIPKKHDRPVQQGFKRSFFGVAHKTSQETPKQFEDRQVARATQRYRGLLVHLAPFLPT